MTVTSSSVIGYLFPDSPFEYGLLYLKAVSYHSLIHKPLDSENNHSHKYWLFTTSQFIQIQWLPAALETYHSRLCSHCPLRPEFSL